MKNECDADPHRLTNSMALPETADVLIPNESKSGQDS